MVDWLRYFGLSFFSDKLAREGKNHNFFNFILSFALALVLLFCGLVTAFALPFKGFYKDAPSFDALAENLFANLSVEIRDGRLYAEEVVNTYTDEEARARFSMDGYNVIVDTRPQETYDAFEAYCIAADGTRIRYDEYLSLPKEEQEGYSFTLEYSANALDLDDALMGRCEEYLSAIMNEDVVAQFKGLKEKREADETAYRRGIYELYVSVYYPDLKAFERSGSAPLLRTYYYREYVADKDARNRLLLLDDVLIGDFTTKKGIRVSFYGFYSGMKDGTVKGENARSFLLSARKSSMNATVRVFLNNFFLYLPVLVLIPLVFALILWIAWRIVRAKRPYIDCLKIVGSFILWTGLFAALLIAVCSFFTAADIVNALPIPLFAGILLLRTVIFLIRDLRSRPKKKRPAPTEGPSEETEELEPPPPLTRSLPLEKGEALPFACEGEGGTALP